MDRDSIEQVSHTCRFNAVFRASMGGWKPTKAMNKLVLAVYWKSSFFWFDHLFGYPLGRCACGSNLRQITRWLNLWGLDIVIFLWFKFQQIMKPQNFCLFLAVLFLVGWLDFWIHNMAYSINVRFQAILRSLKFLGPDAFCTFERALGEPTCGLLTILERYQSCGCHMPLD